MSNLVALPVVYRQGRGSVSSDNLNTFLQSSLTAAELATLTGIPGMVVLVQGTTGPGTDGCSFYYWNDQATGGSGAIIPPSAASGVWLPLPFGPNGSLGGTGYRFVDANTVHPHVTPADHLGIVFCDASLGDVTILFNPTVMNGEMVTFVRSDLAPNIHSVFLTDGTTNIQVLTLDQTAAVLKSVGTAIRNIPSAINP